jgi:translation elongation factor EF-4
MKKKLSDGEKIKALLDFLRLNAKKFSIELGLTNPDVIYHIIRERNCISKALASKIIEKFPNISLVWLTTGEGEMLRNGVNQTNVEGDNIQGHNFTVNKSQVDALLEIIKTKDEQLSKSQEQIDKLVEIIGKLTNK